MRCYKGLWYYQGKVYPTLRSALLAAWKNATASANDTDGGEVEQVLTEHVSANQYKR